MKHLSIIVPDGQSDLSTIASIIGAYSTFKEANQYWKESGQNELFKIELTGVSKKVNMGNGLLAMTSLDNISTIEKTDLIIIPSSGIRNYDQAMKGNQQLIDWIAEQYKEGAEIASICTGAFMLASTGLLDGKNCSTHWAHADTFRVLFPKVNLQVDKVITDEHGIYTNGGGYSFLNLMIYLIEKYYDRPTAIYCAKIMEIEIDRHSQSPFAIFTGQKQHTDDMVIKAQEYIESKPQEKISVEQLSSHFSVSRRTFDRRFIKATGNTPFEYSQRVKMELAKKFFETTRKSIGEVMSQIGYSDEKAFRETFRKITGMTPLDYRNRYNKEVSLA